MTAEALDSDYENGVADVLAYLAGDAAKVDRNVRMLGQKSGKQRQIDVRVFGSVFGLGDATMVVDCKRYMKPVDVVHAGAFASLVEDVGADVGLLVTATGITEAARQYARNVRGIRLDILPLVALDAWNPRGTVHFDFAVPAAAFSEGARSARRAGFRVKAIEVETWRNLDDHIGLHAYRHFGTASPSGEIQLEAQERLVRALRQVGVDDPVAMGSGVVASGGTPAHRWLEVIFSDEQTGLKVLVSSEQDIKNELDQVATHLGAPRELLDVLRPMPWPIPTIFPAWG
jgi:hypothetical protein